MVKPSAPVLTTQGPATPAHEVNPVNPPVIATRPAPVLASVAEPLTKLQRLGGAVATDVTDASRLTVPPELAQGKQGVVSLSLPPSLAERITAEAVKLGLAQEARKVDVRATLSGQGYTVIPSASQSARLKSGESTTFNWQVTPIDGEKGLLEALVGGDLKGSSKSQAFTIAAIQEVQAIAPASGEEASGGFIDKLVLSKSALLGLGALGFLALILLLAVASRISSRRRTAKRRQKLRSMTELHSNPESEAVHKDRAATGIVEERKQTNTPDQA